MLSVESRLLRRIVVRNALSLLLAAGLVGASVGATGALAALLNSFVFNPTPAVDGREVIHAMGLAFNTPDGSAIPVWGRARALERLSTYARGVGDIDSPAGWRTVQTSVVSADFFAVFAEPPLYGRFFREADQQNPHEKGAVISYGLWRGLMGSDASVVGRAIEISGASHTIVGVAREGFDFPSGTEVWLSGLIGGPASRTLRTDTQQQLVAGPPAAWVARLSDTGSLRQAQEQLWTIHKSLTQAYPTAKFGDTIRVRSLRDVVSQRIAPALSLFLAGSLVVLLIASVNAGILLSVHVAGHTRAFAIARALGAPTSVLVWTALHGMLWLWAMVAMVGIGIALAILKAVAMYTPLFSLHAPRMTSLAAAAATAVLLVSVVGVLVAVAIPIAQVPREDLATLLQRGRMTRKTRSNAPRRYLFGALQTMLSVLLVVVAALSTKGLLGLAGQDFGFEPQGALTIETRANEKEPEAFLARQSALLDALRAAPGVQAVGAVSDLPVNNARSGLWLSNGDARTYCGRYAVAGDYFRAAGIPLVAGRPLRDGERGVAVISQAAAQALWRSAPAVGATVSLRDEERGLEVVGVAHDVGSFDSSSTVRCQIYMAFADIDPTAARAGVTPMVARCAGECTRTTIEAIRNLDEKAAVSIGRVSTLQGAVARELQPSRFRAVLSLCYAALGAALAMLGTYALISQTAVQRAPEIGIHMSVGASPWNIVVLLTSKSFLFTLAGAAVGGWVSFGAARFLGQWVTGVEPLNTLTVVASAALLCLSGGLAAAVPAMRLARRPAIGLLRAFGPDRT